MNTNLNISQLANSSAITVNFKDQINVSKVLPYRPLSSSCFEDKGFVIQHYRDSGGETPRHHLQEHIISISLSGSEQVYRRIDGKYNQTKFAPGCTTILPAGCQHWCSWTSSEFLLLAICPETFSQTILGADSNKTVELKPNFLTSDFLLQQIGINLIETVESPNVDLLYADSLFNLLSAHLLRHHAINPQPLETVVQRRERNLKRAIDYIHAHLDRDISLKTLSTILETTTPYQAMCLFEQATGYTPLQYVTGCRVEWAKQLLKNTDLPLAEIATQVGFPSPSQLKQQFLRIVKIAPDVYRADVRQR